MGATFFSLAIQTSNAEAVRDQIVTWMDAKGYELDTSRRMTPLNPDQERGIYLFSNSRWTVALYSDFYEYDRLAFEMRKLKRPSLFLGCQQSDFWGYQLHDGNRLVDEFQTATSYFFLPQNVREPAWQLCTTLGIEDRFYEVCKLMRNRAIFSEHVQEKFCSALGFYPACFDFVDIDDSILGFVGVQDVDGYLAEHLFFRRKNRSRHATSLHDIAVYKPSAPRHDNWMPLSEDINQAILGMHDEIRRRMWMATIVSHLIYVFCVVFIYPTSWLIVQIVRLRQWFAPKARETGNGTEEKVVDFGKGEFGNFMRGLVKLSPNQQRLEGNRIINRLFRCSIEVPTGARIITRITPSQVFRFTLEQSEVHCSVLYDREVRREISERPHEVILDDKFVTHSGLSARTIVISINDPTGVSKRCPFCYIQAGNAYYRIFIPEPNKSEIDREKVLKDLAMTFEILPEEGKNPSDVTELDGPAPQSGGENSRNPPAR